MCECILFTNIKQMLHATGRKTNKTQIIGVTYILTSNNCRIAQSPGDGHCLIYSTISSWNSQLCNHPPINTTWLLDAIRRKFNNNRDRYIDFLIDLEKEKIDRQLSLYLLDKRYNLDIVDVIPAVISNILDVTFKIINEQTNNSCDVIDVYPIQATNGVLAVHRFGDHYNGIVRALNSLPLHQRTTYTREELGQFNKSNLRLPRKLINLDQEEDMEADEINPSTEAEKLCKVCPC